MFLALMLVFCSAILHVIWNVKLKSEKDPLSTTTKALSLGVLCFLPIVFVYWLIVGMPAVSNHVLFLAVLSGIAELGYFWFLAYSYRRGQLSVVYPIARGSAPVLAFAFGILFLNEHISQPQIIGIICLLLGIWLIGGAAISGVRGTIPAILTGLFVAIFMVIDKLALNEGIDPFIYGGLKYGFTALFLVAFIPFRALTGMKASKLEFRSWKKYLFIGVCIIVTYQLILFALTMAPVALVSPLRESASVIVTIWGIWKLKERDRLASKLIGVCAVVTGTVLFAI
jgi:uncharacterized membrane protein